MEAIRFLELAGREQLSAADFASAVADLNIAEAQRQALLDGDHATLAMLLSGRPSMFFGVFAPEEEPLDDEPAEDQPEEPLEIGR
jgi:hypothetical protein